MKKNNGHKVKFIFIILFLVLVCITFIFYSYVTKQDIKNSKAITSTETTKSLEEKNLTTEQMMSEEKVNLVEQLKYENKNNDIKAILQIENTSFQEPVVQTVDNEYYLTHNYKNEKDKLGSIYADYRVNLEAGRKILIFGHSSTKSKTPFNTLENYYDKNYYQKHKYITLQTSTNTYRYEIFSVYIETNDFTYMNLNFDNNNDWYLHILKLQKKSLYKTNVELTEDDDVLILQTCSNNPNYQKYSKKYLLIVSRRVK